MNSTFQLPAELTIYSVGATRDALLAWLLQQDARPGDSVEIEAAQVEEVDGAGIQVLGALAAALSQRGLLWSVKEPSAHLLNVCGAMGSLGWLERTDIAGARA